MDKKKRFIAIDNKGNIVFPYIVDPSIYADGTLPSKFVGTAYSISSGKIISVPSLGNELVTSGDFSTPGSWNQTGGWVIGGGVATATTANTIYQACLSNNFVVVSFDITRIAGGLICAIGSTGYSGGLTRSLTGTHYSCGIRGGDTGLYFVGNGSFTGTLDNVSAKDLLMPSSATLINTNRTLVDVSANWTMPNPGAGSGVVASADATMQNAVFARHDGGTHIILTKIVNGTFTMLQDIFGVTYAAGASVRIKHLNQDTYQVFYNDVQRGTDQTISDASIINNTRFGLFNCFGGNQCTLVSFLAL